MSVKAIAQWFQADGIQLPILVHADTGSPLEVFLSSPDLTNAEIVSLPPDGKLAIKQVRELLSSLGLKTTHTRRLIFIPDAERLQVATANTLLKTLEEASERNRFLLTSAYPGRLLATIRSRCRILRTPHTRKKTATTPPIFAAKRKTPLTPDEADAIAQALQTTLHATGPSQPVHRSLARLRDYHRARAAGVGEKLASDALLASLVNLSLE